MYTVGQTHIPSEGERGKGDKASLTTRCYYAIIYLTWKYLCATEMTTIWMCVYVYILLCCLSSRLCLSFLQVVINSFSCRRIERDYHKVSLNSRSMPNFNAIFYIDFFFFVLFFYIDGENFTFKCRGQTLSQHQLLKFRICFNIFFTLFYSFFFVWFLKWFLSFFLFRSSIVHCRVLLHVRQSKQ